VKVRTPQPDKSPEPTAVGAVSSAIAVHATSRRWLSFLRRRVAVAWAGPAASENSRFVEARWCFDSRCERAGGVRHHLCFQTRAQNRGACFSVQNDAVLDFEPLPVLDRISDSEFARRVVKGMLNNGVESNRRCSSPLRVPRKLGSTFYALPALSAAVAHSDEHKKGRAGPLAAASESHTAASAIGRRY